MIFFFYQRNKIICPQQKTIKNYQNFLAEDLKDQFIGINIKQKVRINILQMNIDISMNQTLLS